MRPAASSPIIKNFFCSRPWKRRRNRSIVPRLNAQRAHRRICRVTHQQQQRRHNRALQCPLAKGHQQEEAPRHTASLFERGRPNMAPLGCSGDHKWPMKVGLSKDSSARRRRAPRTQRISRNVAEESAAESFIAGRYEDRFATPRNCLALLQEVIMNAVQHHDNPTYNELGHVNVYALHRMPLAPCSGPCSGMRLHELIYSPAGYS